TCPANDLVAPIHPRMPVILGPQDHAQWLDPETAPDAAASLLRPYPAGAMAARAVSTHVNSPKNDDSNCIAALLA
ncbi:MAG: SOS response-associated peptidase family protein, partial [Alphaproteobacteria bacterium]|nr:SOS response-associated peptidase family protein [Alphaproteobacteria bacterium]